MKIRRIFGCSSGSAGVRARRARRPAGHIRNPLSILHSPFAQFLVAICLCLAATASFAAAAPGDAPAGWVGVFPQVMNPAAVAPGGDAGAAPAAPARQPTLEEMQRALHQAEADVNAQEAAAMKAQAAAAALDAAADHAAAEAQRQIVRQQLDAIAAAKEKIVRQMDAIKLAEEALLAQRQMEAIKLAQADAAAQRQRAVPIPQAPPAPPPPQVNAPDRFGLLAAQAADDAAAREGRVQMADARLNAAVAAAFAALASGQAGAPIAAALQPPANIQLQIPGQVAQPAPAAPPPQVNAPNRQALMAAQDAAAAMAAARAAARASLDGAVLAAAAADEAAASQPDANAAQPPGDLLQFLDGAVLHGALKGVDAARGLRWEHPDAKTPFDLMPAHVDFVRFTQAKSLALAPSCHIRFGGGDDLFGSLVSMDATNLEFSTWFGGTLKVPRASLQTITFLPRNYSIAYEGPADASDWVIRGGAQNGGIRVIGGNGVFMNGGLIGGGMVVNQAFVNGVVVNGGMVTVSSADVSRSSASGPANWTYQDGSFVTSGAGTLGRNFNLSGSCTIEFDLSCNGPFNLLLDLYSTTLERAMMNNKSFLVSLSSSQISLLRSGYTPASQVRSVNVTNFDLHGKPARVTLQCNLDEGSLAAQVDGVEVSRWTDLGNLTGMGPGFVVQNQQIGTTVKLSHIKVSKWEGKYEPDFTPAVATNADMVSFINRDKAGGKVESFAGGELGVNLGGHVLQIPAERVRRIDFAKPAAVAEPRGPWEVRAVFPGGGSVSFQLDKWDDKAIAGHSALFGSVSFQPDSIREIEFNLDHPRTASAASGATPYDALDQNRAEADRPIEIQYDVLDQ